MLGRAFDETDEATSLYRLQGANLDAIRITSLILFLGRQAAREQHFLRGFGVGRGQRRGSSAGTKASWKF